ncbi:MAG: metallophosphoesterase family protein [Planctomycetes bacterium]|nr:metallophosphoesterase family protein [Planctomycetota bacterium]
MTRVGVVADTHGVVHPAVFDLFRNVAAIVHAGDVGSDSVIADLEALAPVVAVRGNVDVGASALLEHLPDERTITIESVRLFVTHVGGSAGQVRTRFGERLRRDRVRVFVCGHSHRALLDDSGDLLILNPGGAGRRRFSIPLSAAILAVKGDDVRVRIVDLDDASAVRAAIEG